MLRRVLRCSVPPATKPGIAAIVSSLHMSCKQHHHTNQCPRPGPGSVQAGACDKTALEVHVGEDAEEAHDLERHAIRCCFGLKMRLLRPSLVQAV